MMEEKQITEKNMMTTFHLYNHHEDYQRVEDFFKRHHQPGNADGNWLAPMWEYMHHHPALDSANMGAFGVWEEAGKIVAVAHYESSLGEAFFQCDPARRDLQAQMLDYAETNLRGTSKQDNKKYLCAYAHEQDEAFQTTLKTRGYVQDESGDRPLYRFEIPNPFPKIELPDGFRLISLADECDWIKVNRVMWRGFNHAGEPPASEQDMAERQRMFDTPNARRALKIAARTSDGSFVSFAGMFYNEANPFVYVEPVATDPEYRRMGLGKAAVLEGIRRGGLLGASVAYVGSDQAFYQSFGFRKVHISKCWVKRWDDRA